MLLGHEIVVCTDHKNLVYKQFNTERVMRWRLLLEEFGPKLIYIKGQDNIVADALGGIDKDHLRRHFRMTAVPEGKTKGKTIAAHTVKEDGKRASMAERMADILSNEERKSGLKGHRKHAKREGNSKIDERHYHVQHHGNTDSEANALLKLLNTKFVTEGFPSISGQKQNGLICHHHFVACPQLGVGRVAARRIPCACVGCRLTMSKDWVSGLTPEEQPRFKPTVDCKCHEVLGSLNDWKILQISHKQDVHCGEEMEEIFEDILGELESANARLIQPGNFGA